MAASTPKFNSKSPTIRRILREAQELSASPSADYTASPLEEDLFEWHFTLRGPPGSAYAEGIYHGRIVLPPTYPLRPPSFRFTTPSGRFEANREICLSISGHHEETWQPAWGLRTALVALRAFMETDPKGQVGGLDAPDALRRRLAGESRSWRCAACGGHTNEEVMRECEARAREADEAAAGERRKAKEEEEKVPPELRMAFRDELEASAAAAAASTAAAASEAVPPSAPSTAQAGPGVIDVATPSSGTSAAAAAAAVATHQEAPSPAPAPAYLPARPGQGVPQPTRTIPLPNLEPDMAAQEQEWRQAHRHSDDAVPVWVDRAIVVLAVALIAMLTKMILGL